MSLRSQLLAAQLIMLAAKGYEPVAPIIGDVKAIRPYDPKYDTEALAKAEAKRQRKKKTNVSLLGGLPR